MIGASSHSAAVDRLRASYAAIAPDETVRLAKKTSNLFRQRNVSSAPGLDVAGLSGVVSIDTEAQTADVQGMCTYEDLVAEPRPASAVATRSNTDPRTHGSGMQVATARIGTRKSLAPPRVGKQGRIARYAGRLAVRFVPHCRVSMTASDASSRG